ncbi:hypothetical protein OR263_17395 [Streptomyces sp. NEAU-H22]|uniref:hypothetical protein n=1 Tax=unclassified Streptomyces TaxID=2593676 RepID=UPI00224E3EE4|nr:MULTISPECIES: hypothetical protein [unclassified Streptomyces]MCX3288458.1 hypothetical protein [Streptomyces sp. NEAU-H22]WMD08399.1 hypothetical protein Q7C01_30265 [Streptomyces sp. FXY-T5]
MRRLFRKGRGPALSTSGPYSPIIHAPNNSAPIEVRLSGGELYRLGDAPQAYRAYADALTQTYYQHNPLVAEFLRFMGGKDRGYFAVEAEPGMGKSAFAAWVEGRPETDAAHFVQNGAGAGRTATAVRSLGAQLITTWQLDDLAPDKWLPGGSGEPEWLALVIERSAARRDQQRPGRPIVIVVDALDAVREYPVRELPFGLPRHLPGGVYVVVTARTGRLRNTPADQTHRVTLPPDDPGNLEALDGFLRTCSREDARLARALDRYGVGEGVFAAQVLERSRGSWVYAHYVLESISENPQTVCSLPDLPGGLDAYYEERALPLCLSPDGQPDERRIALLAALGAAAEPVDGPTLCSLAGTDEPSLVDTLMRDGLRPFCTVVTPEDDPDGPPRYTPHHPSLREYLSGSSDADLRRAARAAHARICDRYLTTWGGLDSGLDALAGDLELADADAGYPVRQMVSHLLEAGREPDVHRLLALSRHGRNLWYTAHEQAGGIGAYLRDIELAEAAAGGLGTRLRYRLIRASVTSAVTALPPGLVREMVTRGLWTAEQAFHRVQRMGDTTLQARALGLLVPDLSKRLHPEVLALVAAFPDEDRAAVLEEIIPLLDDGLIAAVVEPVLATDSGLPLPGPLVALAARLPLDELRGLPHHPLLADKHGNKAYVRATAALFLHPDRRAGARKALRILRSVKYIPYPEQLIALLTHMPADETFDDVLTLLEDRQRKLGRGGETSFPGAHGPADRVERLLSVLRAGMDMRMAAFVLHRAAGLDFSTPRASDLLDMALRLHLEQMGPGRLYCALVERLSTTAVRDWLGVLFPPEGAARRRLFTEVRHLLLGALLRRLPPEEARAYAEAEMWEVPEIPSAWESRAHLVEYLSPESRRRYVAEVSGGWTRYGGSLGNALHWQTLDLIGPHLSEEELALVLEGVNTDDAREARARLTALDALAPFLPDHLLPQAVADSAHRSVRGQAEALSAVSELARLLPPERRTSVEKRSLAFIRDVLAPPAQADAVAELGPALSADAAVSALAILESAPDTPGLWIQPRAVGEWESSSSRSSDGSVSSRAVLRPVYELGGAARAVEALSTALPDEVLPQAWAVAVRGAEGEGPAQVALRSGGLVSRLISAGWGGLPDDVLPEAAAHTRLSSRDEVVHFLRLADLVSVEEIRRARDALLTRGDCPPRRAETLAHLSRRLPEPEKHSLVKVVLNMLASTQRAHRGTDTWHRWIDPRALGCLYRAGAITAATDALRELLLPEVAEYVLDEFGPPLPAPVVEEALAMVFADHSGVDKARILGVLAPSLGENQIRTVVRDAVDTEPVDDDHLRLLTALARRLEQDAANSALLREVVQHAWRAGGSEIARDEAAVRTFVPLLRRIDAAKCEALVAELIEHHSPDPSSSWKPASGFDSCVAVLAPEELAALYDRVSLARNLTSRAVAQATVLRRLGDEWPGVGLPGTPDLLPTWPTDIDRPTLCRLLSSSAWWIRRRQGGEGVEDVVDALLDVCTWWP